MMINVLVVGDYNVGKTSIVKKFINKNNELDNDYIRTMLHNLYEHNNYFIIDYAAHNYYDGYNYMNNFGKIDFVIYVFSLTDIDSLNYVQNVHNGIMTDIDNKQKILDRMMGIGNNKIRTDLSFKELTSGINNNTKFLLVGNKSDINNNANNNANNTMKNNILSFCKNNKLKYHQTSAKKNTGITELFYEIKRLYDNK